MCVSVCACLCLCACLRACVCVCVCVRIPDVIAFEHGNLESVEVGSFARFFRPASVDETGQFVAASILVCIRIHDKRRAHVRSLSHLNTSHDLCTYIYVAPINQQTVTYLGSNGLQVSQFRTQIVIVIVISKLLKRHSKYKRRVPVYSRALKLYAPNSNHIMWKAQTSFGWSIRCMAS